MKSICIKNIPIDLYQDLTRLKELSGRRVSKTVTFKGFTNNGVNRVGYKRKKKTKKTQQVQYADDDHHPFQSRIISYGGVSFIGHDGSVLSGSIPYLCFTTIVQCNDLIHKQEI